MVPSVVASCIVCTAVGALSWNLIRQACQQEQRVPGIGWVSRQLTFLSIRGKRLGAPRVCFHTRGLKCSGFINHSPSSSGFVEAGVPLFRRTILKERFGSEDVLHFLKKKSDVHQMTLACTSREGDAKSVQ
eukprot:g33509.t1